MCCSRGRWSGCHVVVPAVLHIVCCVAGKWIGARDSRWFVVGGRCSNRGAAAAGWSSGSGDIREEGSVDHCIVDQDVVCRESR